MLKISHLISYFEFSFPLARLQWDITTGSFCLSFRHMHLTQAIQFKCSVIHCVFIFSFYFSITSFQAVVCVTKLWCTLFSHLLSVELLKLVLLCPHHFILLAHPAKFCLMRRRGEKNKSCEPLCIIKWSIMSSIRETLNLHQCLPLLAYKYRHAPCSLLDPTVRKDRTLWQTYEHAHTH